MTAKKDKKTFPRELELPEYMRSEAVRELFEIRDGELDLKTETPRKALKPFVFMEVVEAAFDIKRERRLSTIYRTSYDRRMISVSRKGRTELLAALSSIMKEGTESELGI